MTVDHPHVPTITRAPLTRRCLLSLAAASLLAGCTVNGTSDPDEPVDPLPDEQLVFAASSGAGISPEIYQALQSPIVVLYGSGLIIASSGVAGSGAVPRRYVEAHVDPLIVARFVRDAERDHVLSGDFGMPQVTDLGADHVRLHGAGGAQEVSAYALAAQFDDLVSQSQRRRRRRLRGLIDDASRLIGDASQPYAPSRVVVLEQQALTSAEPTTLAWPGPDPGGFLHPPGDFRRQAIACGEVTGADATTVYQAAMANPGQRWLVDGETRVLVVNSLPIDIDC